jgi:hypothetical protein
MVEKARRSASSGLLAAAAIALLAGCTDQSKVYEGDMTQMLAVLPGRYDNRAQAEADIRGGVHPAHEAVALTITHVYTPRLGHHVYYAQETAADDPRRVLSERMYSFQVDEKRGIVETLYQFVEPLRWRDGQQNKELFTSVTSEDVQAEGCQLFWKKKDERFVGAHDPKACPDPAGAPPAVELSAGVLNMGDYKFRTAR